MINFELLDRKREFRKKNINTLVETKSMSFQEAARWYDLKGALTTNRKQLAELDFAVDQIDADNICDVIQALSYLGIILQNSDQFSTEALIPMLHNILDEEIPECWGGTDVLAIIELGEYANG